MGQRLCLQPSVLGFRKSSSNIGMSTLQERPPHYFWLRRGWNRSRNSGRPPAEENDSDPGSGYARYALLLGLTAASATTLAIIFVHSTTRKTWRQRLEKCCQQQSWMDRLLLSGLGGQNLGDMAALEIMGEKRALASLGLRSLDLACPPSNVTIHDHHSCEIWRPGRVSRGSVMSVISLTINDGGTTAKGREPARRSRSFLLVELPLASGADTLGIYETLAAGRARGLFESGSEGDDIRYLANWAQFTCPYHGTLRVGCDTPALTASSDRSGHDAAISSPGSEGSTRLFLALGDPREGMRTPCTLALKMGKDAFAPKESDIVLQGRRRLRRERRMRFGFKGMHWEGKATGPTLCGVPSAWGPSLRLSLGEDWGRQLAPEEFEFRSVFSRFFHDGVGLQAGKVVSVLSKLRALVRLYDCRIPDEANGDRDWSNFIFLPATIIIAYDTSTGPVYRGLDGAVVGEGGDAWEGHRTREEYQRSESPTNSTGSTGEGERGESVVVRMVEVKAAHWKDEEAGVDVLRGLRQIIRLLEEILDQPSIPLVPPPAGWPTSRMPFADLAAIPDRGMSPADDYLPTPYRRRSRLWEAFLSRSEREEKHEVDGDESSRIGSVLPTSIGDDSSLAKSKKKRGERRGRSEGRGALPKKEGGCNATGLPRASRSPVSGSVPDGRAIHGAGGRTRSDGKCGSTGGTDGNGSSESHDELSITRVPPLVGRPTRKSEKHLRRRWARSLLMDLPKSSAPTPLVRGANEQKEDHGEWWKETVVGAAQETDLRGRTFSEERDLDCEIGRVRFGGTRSGGRVGDTSLGPLEEHLLDEIGTITSRLPRLVQRSLHRLRRQGRETSAAHDLHMISVLEGWKSATEALDQSHRELRCYREVECEASSAILGDLEVTMATFRGQVLVMTGRNADWLACRAKRCSQSPQQASKLFKEAHLAIKSVVVLAGGDAPSGARWRLSERHLLSIAGHHLTPLLENLRLLVVAFDNMREEDRAHTSTVEEIVNNRDWLLRLATFCTSAERRAQSRHNRNAILPSHGRGSDRDSCSDGEKPEVAPPPFTAAATVASEPPRGSTRSGERNFGARVLRQDRRIERDTVPERYGSAAEKAEATSTPAVGGSTGEACLEMPKPRTALPTSAAGIRPVRPLAQGPYPPPAPTL